MFVLIIVGKESGALRQNREELLASGVWSESEVVAQEGLAGQVVENEQSQNVNTLERCGDLRQQEGTEE